MDGCQVAIIYIYTVYLRCVFFLSILFGRHVQKNCKVKQIIYDMINFISSFREPFPLSRKTAYNIMSTFLIKISIRQIQII